jgi:autotransporter-associated beta strand protein
MGSFAVNTQGQNDTWSNNISDVAVRARRAEDQAEAAAWNARMLEKGWNVTPPAAPPPPPTEAAAQQAYYASAAVNDYTEYTVGMARQAARETRVYEGSLAKFGAGALTLTGSNSYSGGTQVHGGSLVAASAHALGTGNVDVFGGTFATRSAQTVLLGGNLTVGSSGILDLGLGLGSSLLLDVGGRLTFGGQLNISFLDGFLGIGQYDLIGFRSFGGTFSNYAFTGLSPFYTADLVFRADGVGLNVAAVPEPETYALMLAGLGALGWAARRRKRALPAAPVSDDAAPSSR